MIPPNPSPEIPLSDSSLIATDATQAMIRLFGVRVHNLQSVDVELPVGKLIALCGVSGSGKSSLAMDTLFAESQRRYLESFSIQSQRFFRTWQRPEVDRFEGLRPSIAVAQPTSRTSDRQSLGTVSEIEPHLQLLFAQASTVICQCCGREVVRDSPTSVADYLEAIPEKTAVLLTFSLPAPSKNPKLRAKLLQEEGFRRLIIAEELVRIEDVINGKHQGKEEEDSKAKNTFWNVVVDRVQSGGRSARLLDSLEMAFRYGSGTMQLWQALPKDTEESTGHTESITYLNGDAYCVETFTQALRCGHCGREFPEPEPQLFNQRHRSGQCPACQGSGLFTSSTKKQQTDTPCPTCSGTGRNPIAEEYFYAGQRYSYYLTESLEKLKLLFEKEQRELDRPIYQQRLVEQISQRLNYLSRVGLGYLQLGRTFSTLSSGEWQRVVLTRCLASGLVHALYILDEPSSGLHPADQGPLIEILQEIRDQQNTLLVIDHHRGVLDTADWIIEMGPGAGEEGGNLVYAGTKENFLQHPDSPTAKALAKPLKLKEAMNPPPKKWLQLQGISGRFFDGLDLSIPLGKLTVLTGVSGAGKTSLLRDALFPALQATLQGVDAPGFEYQELIGSQYVNGVQWLDQSPMTKTSRSNAATYLKAFDAIRSVFAETPDAKSKNLSKSNFSFNSPAGRCLQCQGEGQLRIEMQCLPDVFVVCPECEGTRFRPEILEVYYRGMTIAEVLQLSAREAFRFFRGQPTIQTRLKPLLDVGLDYLQIGQPANTFSGGEAQRLKLASLLAETKVTRTLLLLDEPTRGLHPADIDRLMQTWRMLLEVGHTVLIAESRLQVLAGADHLIELGPGPAAEGGKIIATGSPQELSTNPTSRIGPYLKSTF
ncbi:Excinuclease ABC subunit A [Planctomycetales bacterium 10988]|nr:Excinuclease ABC subunit A [Planctomycetales bacterium 10988]